MRSRVVVVVAGALVACTCGFPQTEYFGRVRDPDPTTLHFCNNGEPEYLDPALVSSTTGVKLVYALFDGLTEFNLQGLPEPSLATRWDIAAGQRLFTFHLRKDARWSNGRPLTAHDFVYSMTRVLHPLTASKNAEVLWRLKNGELYTANRVRLVVGDEAAFPKGSIVEIIGMADEAESTEGEETATIPDTNVRKNSRVLLLQDHPDWPEEWKPKGDPYPAVPVGQELTIIELGGPDRSWAYVHWAHGDGAYGWVPLRDVERAPNANRRYRVRLRPPAHVPGVFFPALPEGAAMAEAVIAGRDLLMLPEVLGLRATDDYTLVLETNGPVPYLIDTSPQRSFRPTPREAVSRRPKRWIKPGDTEVVTSGSFRLTTWKTRNYIELTRSDSWWRRDDVRLERVIAYSMNDQAASANYYYYGKCDATAGNNIPGSYFPILDGSKTGHAYKDYRAAPYLGSYFYLINTKRFPNVHFRRALSLAIDRTPIPKITKGGQIPTAQFMPGRLISELSPEELALCGVAPDDPGVASIVSAGKVCYVPPPGLDYDPEAARRELELARQELGPAFPSEFTLKFNSGTESHKHIAEWLQQVWKRELDLDVELQVQEWKTFLKDTVNGDYDVARMGWIGAFPDPEAEFLPQFKCASPDNRPQWCNEQFDALYAKAETISERGERLAVIREAEALLLREVPIIPLYIYTQHHLRKPYVRDMAINPVDQIPFWRVWIDPDWRNAAKEAN